MRFLLLCCLTATTLSSAACHTMRPITLDELGGVRPTRVWVTRPDQTVVLVEGPQVLNNRLVGFVNGKYQVMPAADVRALRMRTPARGRTAMMVTAGAVGMAAVAVLVSGAGKGTDPCTLASSECDPTEP